MTMFSIDFSIALLPSITDTSEWKIAALYDFGGGKKVLANRCKYS